MPAVNSSAPTVPHYAFMIFQAMFAIITPALICGAYAERVKFKGFVVFSLLWATFVYDPIAHWVWGGGFFQGRAWISPAERSSICPPDIRP